MALARPFLAPVLGLYSRPSAPQYLFASRTSFSTTLASGALGAVAIHLNILPSLSSLWDSVLRAVPKKKTSYSKKRSRFLAGKALKDVNSLNTCSACGTVKRAHLLCPYCVQGNGECFFSCDPIVIVHSDKIR